MFRFLIFFFALTLLIRLDAQGIAMTPLLHAHSHNDYQHDLPLWGALAQGATSIEIDVFAHKGMLKISHIKFALNIRESFEDMYLEPLVKIIEERGGIYSEVPLVLMIDFKTNSDSTLPLLLEAIAPYKAYFSYYYEDSVYQKDLQLVISGNGFTYNQVKTQDSIFVFLDGNVHHCEEDFPPQLVPRGSTKYNSIFTWKGKGEIPENELIKLREMLAEAKKCNKKLRFYAMPANERIWHTFLQEGVDWINLDNIQRFRIYYRNKNSFDFSN